MHSSFIGIRLPTTVSVRSVFRTTGQRLLTRFTHLTCAMRAAAPTRMRDRQLGGDMHEPSAMSFERLHALLRLADRWPSGSTGTSVRRAACDLIESNSRWGRASARRRLRVSVARAGARRTSGRALAGDPDTRLLDELTDALQREGRPWASVNEHAR